MPSLLLLPCLFLLLLPPLLLLLMAPLLCLLLLHLLMLLLPLALLCPLLLPPPSRPWHQRVASCRPCCRWPAPNPVVSHTHKIIKYKIQA